MMTQSVINREERFKNIFGNYIVFLTFSLSSPLGNVCFYNNITHKYLLSQLYTNRNLIQHTAATHPLTLESLVYAQTIIICVCVCF